MRHRFMRLGKTLLKAAIPVAMVFCACLAATVAPAQGMQRASEQPPPLTSVTLQLKWAHQFQFAGYYAAQKNGYYRKRGLDVRINPAMPGDEPMDQVVKGDAEFGIGTTDLLLMRAKGDPVVVLAAIFQHSPLALMADGRSDWRHIHEFAQGTLMIEPHSAELLAYFSQEGLNLDKLKFVDHSFNTEDLAHGRVDAMSVYFTDEPFEYRKETGPYRLLRPIESGIDFYGDNLFTTQKVIDDKPNVVRGFVEASLEGWRYALANPEEMADYILATYGDRKSREHLLFEAAQMTNLILSDVVPVGFMNPNRWDRIAHHYASLGMLPKDLSLSGFLYSSDPASLPTWLGQAFVATALALIVALGIGLWLVAFNRRLHREVKVRRQTEAALAERSGQLEESNSQKDLLMSVIGHDVRNMFSPILIYAHLLSDKRQELSRDDVAGYGEKLSDAGRDALEVLENILEWALVRTGQRKVSPQIADLAELVRTTASTYRTTAAIKGIALSIDADRPVVARFDDHAMATVLRNLINNALKFTEENGQVTVSLAKVNDKAILTITDTGVGMNPNLRACILEGNESDLVTGDKGDIGTGLGLTLCRQLILANQGDLEIDSRDGQGTTVTVKLPTN